MEKYFIVLANHFGLMHLTGKYLIRRSIYEVVRKFVTKYGNRDLFIRDVHTDLRFGAGCLCVALTHPPLMGTDSVQMIEKSH